MAIPDLPEVGSTDWFAWAFGLDAAVASVTAEDGSGTVLQVWTRTEAGAAWQDAQGGEATVQDATAETKGVVQLAGDLGGTADAPTVPGKANQTYVDEALQGKADDGWAGEPVNSVVVIQFDDATQTWPPAPTGRLDLHFRYQGGDEAHPPPGRADSTTEDSWVRKKVAP